MTTADQEPSYIQERLDSLSNIDFKIVDLLQDFSNLFENHSESKNQQIFTENTSKIFKNLSTIAIDLRKEIKKMDDNIGCFNKNKDNIMILPINVDQKNGKLGFKKLNFEINELKNLLGTVDENEIVEVELKDEDALDTSKMEIDEELEVKEEKIEIKEENKPNETDKAEIKEEEKPIIETNDIETTENKNNEDEDDDMEDLF
ncbi:MED11 [Candida jiufengensis]|uniref:MED11 n=1 Tax=Candida jiufengensis TaxID=497108 RepID=UPI0022247CBA|nr:MED11 [Candida jiufengensis]KAI5950164.1 MED11 [Candida jiufengensis]